MQKVSTYIIWIKGVFGGLVWLSRNRDCCSLSLVHWTYSYNMMHADTGLLRSPSLNTSSLPPFLLNSANCAISCCSVVGATLTVFSDINWGRERDCGILCGKKTREVSKAVLFSVRSKQSTQLHTHVIATPSRAGTNLQLADSISVAIRLS